MTEADFSKQWMVYLVECSDGSLYCGITNDVAKRIQAHNNGTGAKYTRGRGPVQLVATSTLMNHFEAARLECHIKSLPRDEKINALSK